MAAFNLQIQPTLKTKDMKILMGISTFIENTEVIRHELERRALRAAIRVAPERAGGLKKAIEILKSTPIGYTLGVSNSIVSGKAAVKKTEKIKGLATSIYLTDYRRPKEFKRKTISKPSRYIDDPDDLFAEKSEEQYQAELKSYHKAVAAENKRVNSLKTATKLRSYTKVTNFQKGKNYNQYRDGGGKVRANMQEFGYPYKTGYWGPYKPNPNAPNGPKGKGYLRLGQVLAAKSLTKDSIDYTVSISNAQVVGYERTVTDELVKAIKVLLAKYLKKQKLPAYFKGVDKLKQKAPIAERSKAYGTVSNIEVELPLQFPENPYTRLERGNKLSGISQSVTGRPFEPGYDFLIDS